MHFQAGTQARGSAAGAEGGTPMAEHKRHKQEKEAGPEQPSPPAAKAGKGGWKLVAGALVLALLLGAGAFYAVYSGLVALPRLERAETAAAREADPARAQAYRAGAYVALDPLVVSLGPEAGARHLRVELVVEVESGREREVAAERPRLLDVLNGFLRAVEARDLALPRSMERLRAQMLRRVQLVAPEGAVRDLLIQEFVLN